MRTNRGQHPDLDDNGDLLPGFDLSPSQRDRVRMDDAERDNEQERIRAWQSRLPTEVQQAIQGRSYPSLDAYQLAAQHAMANWGASQGKPIIFTDAEIADMDLATYDVWFGEHGQPRDSKIGVWYTRGIRLDSRNPR